jgi:hypothetical protein
MYEMAWRLRESGVSSAPRVRAIAGEGRIDTLELEQQVLPALEQLEWIKINHDRGGAIVSIDEVLPPADELLASASTVVTVMMPDSMQRAAFDIVRAASDKPLEHGAAIDAAATHGEEAAVTALRHLSTVGLVRKVHADDGKSAVFSPHIWVGEAELTKAALRCEDGRIQTEVGALLEEVSAHPGTPESFVTSTDQGWVDFAVHQGLIERSVIFTSEGDEQRFLFSPQLSHSPMSDTYGDPSGQVRQLVAAMIYAATFARYRLRNPASFVRHLINHGEAGDTSPIGTTYPMLETAGIVEVTPGSAQGRYHFEMRQRDVAEAALEILSERDDAKRMASIFANGLGSQRSYTHIECERAEQTLATASDGPDIRRLVAALRQATS